MVWKLENLASLFADDAKIYTYQGDMLSVDIQLYESYFSSLDSLEWTPHGMSKHKQSKTTRFP